MMQPNDNRAYRGKSMTGRLQSVLICGAALVLSLMAACATERGLDPQRVKYLLYAGMQSAQGGHIAIYDTDADTLYDSIPGDFATYPGSVVASPDGQYLAVSRELWNAKTATPIGTFSHIHDPFDPLFVPDTNLFIGRWRDSLRIYEIPSLTLLNNLEQDIQFPQWIPGTSRIIGTDQYRPYTGPGPDKLVIFEYKTRTVVDSLMGYDAALSGFDLFRHTVSRDGRRVYVLAAKSGEGGFVVCLEIQTRRVVFQQPVSVIGGDCEESPDGHELWITQSIGGGISGPPSLGQVLILAAQTGAPLDTIPTVGLNPDRPESEPLALNTIEFLPDGLKAYINSAWPLWPGPIVVIDTQTREVVKILYGEYRRFPISISLAPVP